VAHDELLEKRILKSRLLENDPTIAKSSTCQDCVIVLYDTIDQNSGGY
jgi:hypothetical protein